MPSLGRTAPPKRTLFFCPECKIRQLTILFVEVCIVIKNIRPFWTKFKCSKVKLAAPHYQLFLATMLLVTLTPFNAQAAKDDLFLPVKMGIAPPTGAQNLCAKYSWACTTARHKKSLTSSDSQLIEGINRRVNNQTREITDQSQYQQADVWSLPTSRGGDCEDFALLKKMELVRAGISPERLLLATVLDRSRNSHAVLVLRTDTGDYVLDNLTNRIKTWQSTRYTFLRMQNPSAPKSWVGVLAGG